MAEGGTTTRPRAGRPKLAIAQFLHANRSTHTHNLGESEKSCHYCDLDAHYALRALEDAGFDIDFPDRCTGAVRCQASTHVHGCYSDFGACDEPQEHPPGSAT